MVLLADDFSDPQRGRLSRSSSNPDRFENGYFDGDYFIRRMHSDSGRDGWKVFVPGTYRDSPIGVDVRFVDPRQNSIAYLSCRWSPSGSPSSGYRLGLLNGFLNLERWSEGQSKLLVSYPRSVSGISGITDTASWNRIGLQCNGDEISVIANGTVIGSVRDDTYSEGRLAIDAAFAPPVEGMLAEARFGNLAVVGPRPGPVSAPAPAPATVAPSAAPQGAPVVLRQYPERRADGSTWLVRAWSDGTYDATVQVSAAQAADATRAANRAGRVAECQREGRSLAQYGIDVHQYEPADFRAQPDVRRLEAERPGAIYRTVDAACQLDPSGAVMRTQVDNWNAEQYDGVTTFLQQLIAIRQQGVVMPQQPGFTVPSGGVIESQINGEFTGWDGDTVFVLANGQVWQQASYAYTYHYAFRPRVVIYPSGGGYRLQVEGVSATIAVRRLR